MRPGAASTDRSRRSPQRDRTVAHMTSTTSFDPSELRTAARARLERRAAAWRFLLLWVVLAALFVGIWALTSPGRYFWPVWPILGTGIGVVASFLGAYDVFPRIDEDRVDAEMARMSGGRRP